MSLSIWSQTDVFSTDALEHLLLAPLQVHGRRRGETSFSLLHLLQLAPEKQKGNASAFIKSATPRDHARWDVHLTDEWVTRTRDVNVAFARACEIAETIRSQYCSGRASIAWHAMIVHPGSPDQSVHVDDSKFKVGGKRCYYTFIVPLTSDPKTGGTHFPKMYHTFTSYGGALMFDGAVEHAGLGNRSTTKDRVFLYAAIHTGRDEN